MPSNTAAVLFAVALLQEPDRLRLFTYSRDSIHGFKDELLDAFRRELGKHVDSFTEIAYSREEAQVSVQFLGQGELEVEIGEAEEPARYLWRSDESAPRTWAIARVGRFSKEFSVEGRGARDLSRLSKSIADWIRENASAIRDRSGRGGPPMGMRPQAHKGAPRGRGHPALISANLL